MTPGWLAVAGALTAATPPRAHAQRAPASPVTVQAIAPRFHLLSEPGGNLLVYRDDSLTFVAGAHLPSLVARAVALLRETNGPPVRYALVMETDGPPTYGDGGWSGRGATTLAHEMLYVRMRRLKHDTTPGTPRLAHPLPRVGFSRVVQLFLASEEPHIVHDYSGATDADVIVHFEQAGLLMLGNAFSSDGYPALDPKRGGTIAGLIRCIEWFTSNFGADKVEPIVPGRGPVATFDDLKAYRLMLVTVRDRVLAMRAAGQSVEAAVAARPTSDFDARWGRGPVPPDAFVRAVYESLPRK